MAADVPRGDAFMRDYRNQWDAGWEAGMREGLSVPPMRAGLGETPIEEQDRVPSGGGGGAGIAREPSNTGVSVGVAAGAGRSASIARTLSASGGGGAVGAGSLGKEESPIKKLGVRIGLNGSKEGAMLGAIVMPMVPHLFVGVLGGADVSLAVYMYMYTHTHTHTHTHTQCLCMCLVCVYVDMYSIHMYGCTYVCMHACMHACIYA